MLTQDAHQQGGPFYFKSGVTYQGHRPTGEKTKTEADKLAATGYAYYIAHFDSVGKPIRIQKVYQGTTSLYWETKQEKEELR